MMKFLPGKKLLVCAIAINGLMGAVCEAEAQSALVFDFNSGTLPEGSMFQVDRQVVGRRTNDIALMPDSINGRSVQSAVLPGGKTGLNLVLPEGDPLFGKLTALTIAMFVKVDSSASAPIFLHRLKGSRSVPGYFSFDADGKPNETAKKLEFRINTQNGGETMVARDTCEVIEKQWNHFAMVYNGSEVRFYFNGQIVGEPISTFSESIPAIDPTLCDLSTYSFGGSVAEWVVIPNKALSDAQIKALFDKGLSGVDFASLK